MSGLMNDALVERTAAAVKRFSGWLDRYGETSYDHQSFFASNLGRSAKALYYRKPLLGTLAVAPMIFCEAFVPSARRLFWKPQRFPIADAHYAMGFAFLARMYGEGTYYRRGPSTSSTSFRRLAAGVTRITAGDIRSTGRRERAR